MSEFQSLDAASIKIRPTSEVDPQKALILAGDAEFQSRVLGVPQLPLDAKGITLMGPARATDAFNEWLNSYALARELNCWEIDAAIQAVLTANREREAAQEGA